MSDYNSFDFTVKGADILRILKDAAAAGVVPMLYINGMYYNVQLDDIQPTAPRNDELPF